LSAELMKLLLIARGTVEVADLPTEIKLIKGCNGWAGRPHFGFFP
jgi:hypothetical protein